MRIFTHFSVVGFCNTYFIGQEDGGPAILIDPGHIDNELISLIETNHYRIDTVLLTHNHEAHIQGLGTLRKIYSPTIYAGAANSFEYPVEKVHDDQILEICGFHVKALYVPGHSLDSFAYLIDHAIFSGDTLESGRIAATNGFMEQELLINTIESRLMTLNENFLLFPGHGTISKIRIERMFNQDLLRRRTIEKARSFWRSEE